MYEDKRPEAIKAEILAAIRQSQGLSAKIGRASCRERV